MATSDHGVAETAFDAIRCKMYELCDTNEILHATSINLDLPSTKAISTIHLPIHRGYYLRHIAVERAVSLFLQAATDHHGDGRPVQIVSLGAGFGTLFFRLAGKTDTGHPPVRMFEVDCDAISSQKVALLKASPSTFFGANGQVTATDTTTLAATVHHDNGNTSTYVAFACDLGNVTLLARHLAAYGLDPTLPTLVLAECVLAYLTPEASTSLLRWTAEALAECMFVAYDPIGLTDSSTFGAQLQQYFDNKGCALRSTSIMPSVQGYARLLRHVGWRCIRLGHMNAIYDALTTPTERRRVNALEPFDELEDWVLTNHHYGVLVASNNMIGPAAATSSLQAVLAWPSTVAGSSTSYHQSPDSTIITIRAFEQGDERDVRYLFETGHLPTSSKSVRKLVAKALQSDMANISQAYPGPLSGHQNVMAAVNVNAFKPVEAQLVLSLDDLIKQRREAFKQENKSVKKGDAAKSAKQLAVKAKKTNALNQKRGLPDKAPVAQKKKKQQKKVGGANTKPATQDVAASSLTPSQRKRLRKKTSKAQKVSGNDTLIDSQKKSQSNEQPKKQQHNKNNLPKKQQNNNDQPKKKNNTQQPQTQQKKKNVQIKIQRGNGGNTAHKTISPSNNKAKSTQNQDKRNVLFNVTMKGVKGLSLGKNRTNTNKKSEHPVKRLLGNHISNKKPGNKGDDDHLEDVVQGLHANELNTGLPTHYCWVDFWVDFDQHFQMARTAVCLARCAASYKTYAAVHLEAILRNVPLSGILLWRHLMTWQLRWHNRWATGVDESIAIVNAFGARQDVTMKSMAFHPRATGSKSTVLNAVIASDMSYVRLRNFSLVRGTSRSVTESVILANSGV
ncbi:hypothetical protein DYB36_002392 [Aphanomyces astaci]|uniref:[phosphatase 2A protein]-leucine-carboxy methyltransferase n=1 Tax=Aphanomyces astaci TaxID=112090 RepID=A0A397A5Z6_APHAT|nr:hypothetical protein DYB36_002392 [Aphanomyces astaci]